MTSSWIVKISHFNFLCAVVLVNFFNFFFHSFYINCEIRIIYKETREIKVKEDEGKIKKLSNV
jgi:hypothetical protein